MTNQIIHINDQTYNLADHTPMMVQYLQNKVNYPHAIMLYRMGDFYELFFEDAKLASQLLDITLTRRGNDKSGNAVPMAGVPFHAADSYMARLIAKGKTVVICEQIDEANDTSNANENSADSDNKISDSKTSKKPQKGIMKREVVRTLTAGTITDEALFSAYQDSSHTPNVVSIDIQKPSASSISKSKSSLHAGISSLDLSAGTITCQTIHAENLDTLKNEVATVLARFAPSECLINEDRLMHDKTAWLLPWLHEVLTCPIIEVANSDFSSVHARATLCQQFDVQHIDGLGISDSPLVQATTASLIHYARQTQQRQIPHVNQLIVENNQDYLILDDICQRNLEISDSVSMGGTSLLTVLNQCKTPMGKRLLPQQIKRPLRNRSLIRLRADAVEQLLKLAEPVQQDNANNVHVNITPLAEIKQTLSTIADIERISSRISLASAKPRDLSKLADAIQYSHNLAEKITEQIFEPSQSIEGTVHQNQDRNKDRNTDSNKKGLLAMLLEQLPSAKPILNDIARLLDIAIVDEPPAHIRDGGMIKKGYDAELDTLTNLHDNVQDTLDEMAQNHRDTYNLSNLKVGFNKVSGFYFELPTVQSKSAPDIFTRRQTLKSCERYVTEELKTLETDYLNAQSSALAREKLLYSQILVQLNTYIVDIQQLSQAIAQLDVLINWASLAHTYQWHRPVLTENTGELAIIQGRHLVVEAGMIERQQKGKQSSHQYQSSQFVANDCVMGGMTGDSNSDTFSNKENAKLLLVTGPNMGGKSTYMRQVALIVLLASCGSFVPVQSATIGDIDRIFTRIGSADDLAGGKSTFMVEMIETAHILNLATEKSLVLMDEVGRGTSTTDGLAVAYACVKRLADMNCLTLFATHYFELTTLAEQDLRMQNVHVVASEVDGKLLLLHQIRQGFANSSFGLHVAKMAGVPAEVINEAKTYLENSLREDNVYSQEIDNVNKVKIKNIDTELQQADLFGLPTQHLTEKASVGVPNKEREQLQQITSLINATNPDDMTPKQALEWIYTLRESVK